MTRPNLQQALTPASTAQGMVTKTVYVNSIEGPIALVTDQFGTQFRMRRDVMRAKGDPPMIGEAWIVDKLSVNDWVFSVCMSAPIQTRALDTDVQALDQYAGELDKRVSALETPLVCRVILTVDVPMTAATDMPARTNWSATKDVGKVFYPANTAGPGLTAYSRIVIPRSSEYWLGYRSTFTGGSTYNATSYISKNGIGNSAAAIARDSRNISNASNSADRTAPHAHDVVPLVAGDVLYWGNWQSIAGSLLAVNANMTTTLTLHELGPR